ncbi:MAG: hypothetical protein AAF368_20970, partial [Planctomycetota bacterium]
RIRVLEERGEAVRVGSVVLESTNGKRYGGDWQPREKEYLYRRLPVEELVAAVRLGTRTLNFPLGADEGRLDVWVPNSGSLEAVLPAPLNREGDWAELRITVTEVDDPTRSFELRESVSSNASGELRLESAVLPGRYRVKAVWIDEVGDDEDLYPRTPVYSGDLEIRALEVTRVDLAR